MGAINQLLSVGEASIAVLLTEREDGRIEVGLRAKHGYDVSQAASALGGGGHKQAAGAMISGPLEQARLQVLDEVKKNLNKSADDRLATRQT
jgi:phosphoesterase RecJ-like protein